ncbi:hypothetical protein GQ457_03G031410 [Hibiscus cannabinus]
MCRVTRDVLCWEEKLLWTVSLFGVSSYFEKPRRKAAAPDSNSNTRPLELTSSLLSLLVRLGVNGLVLQPE